MADPRLQLEYLKRSYTAVDGLWFVKCEKRLGFTTALQIDHEVWCTMAKIQARKAAELLGLPMEGLENLGKALSFKFEAEDYGHTTQIAKQDMLQFDVTQCPWLEILERTGRTHLAKTLIERICHPELTAWGAQFGCTLCDSSRFGLCTNQATCHIVFVADAGGD